MKAGNADHNLLVSSHLVSTQCWAEGKAWPTPEVAATLSKQVLGQGLLCSFPLFLPGSLSSEEGLPSGRRKLEEALVRFQPGLHILSIWGALKIWLLAGNSAQYSVMTYMEKESKKDWMYVYAQLIHFAVQQKLTQHCKSIILQ